MRALIIDDEAPARLAMRRLLSAFPDIEIAGEAAHGVEGLEQIEALAPDVLFLDIEMPGLNGFEMLAQLASPPWVVFVTAYNQYAVQAFEANALDYLLKPPSMETIERAVNRVRERLAGDAPRLDQALLLRLQAMFVPQAPVKLAAKRGKRIVLVPRRQILYAAAEDKLVFFYTATDKLLTDRTITDLEAMLPAADFFRINRGTLVNLEAVEELYPWLASGTWRVRVRGGAEVDVSRERAKALRDRLGL
ncbi:MAG: LytTR family transcriptional regulator DNA-binding domain-containing protein [Bryobacteraceae bacterium]